MTSSFQELLEEFHAQHPPVSKGVYPPPYDQVPDEVADAAAVWLNAMGYDLKSEHSHMTPRRISWYIMKLLGLGLERKEVRITSFTNANPKVEDMCVVPKIPVWSACSHHLLPFFGHVDFGYIPGERLLGLSKIPRIIQGMAKGFWLQEHLTYAIADKFHSELGAMGVIVSATCVHTCVMMDERVRLGGEVPKFTTCALRGVFAYNPAAKEEFLQHLTRSDS